MKRISLALVLAGAFAGWYAGGAGAGTFRGVVVARDGARHAVAVASRGGVVRTVRVKKLRRVGARVLVRARRLGDGTFRAQRLVVKGRAHRARIHGVVVRRLKGRTLVSAGGTVLSVKAARRFAAAGDDGELEPGDVVDADVEIENDGDLDEQKVQEVGQTNLIELEGKVVSLSPLTIAVEEGTTIQLTVPPAFTLPAGIAVGDEIEAIVSFENNAYTLVTIKDDQAAEQGNQDDQGEDDQGADVEDGAQEVEAEGTVTALSGTSISVQPGKDASPVTFAIPAGLDLHGAKVGSLVEAKGSIVNGTLTLTKLEVKDESGDDDNEGSGDQQSGDDDQSGSGGGDDD